MGLRRIPIGDKSLVFDVVVYSVEIPSKLVLVYNSLVAPFIWRSLYILGIYMWISCNISYLIRNINIYCYFFVIPDLNRTSPQLATRAKSQLTTYSGLPSVGGASQTKYLVVVT